MPLARPVATSASAMGLVLLVLSCRRKQLGTAAPAIANRQRGARIVPGQGVRSGETEKGPSRCRPGLEVLGEDA